MYRIYKIRDVVRIPPEDFGKPLNEAAWKALRQIYEGRVTRDLGVIVAVLDVKVNPEGKIIYGDGATYHDAEFTVLAFNPFIKEVVEGTIVTVTSYGLFVDLGATDGFIHKSQISDEDIEYDPTRQALVLRDTRRIIEKGDSVRARVYNVALMPGKGLRVSLTVRQAYLGKLEWIKKMKEQQASKEKE
ncbi:DNA-directed RNA polymerase [Desulfurococcaceae archaeon MEX13E-LK6-19]|nr:DNA-directed RNA polymerase [Desulfurococcaceae archaeon MEX13E-LK6-19]